ncbi:unnamed protein product [Protopolystoma xenopodis]|uniref:Uncharacterized protein n=1 Tax=Protopolystoma xenopodis TaxID=117903 RepID=A0A448WU79_9PLAT|nr:unnamed protein product [Protopolystoma xenopodis]
MPKVTDCLVRCLDEEKPPKKDEPQIQLSLDVNEKAHSPLRFAPSSPIPRVSSAHNFNQVGSFSSAKEKAPASNGSGDNGSGTKSKQHHPLSPNSARASSSHGNHLRSSGKVRLSLSSWDIKTDFGPDDVSMKDQPAPSDSKSVRQLAYLTWCQQRQRRQRTLKEVEQADGDTEKDKQKRQEQVRRLGSRSVLFTTSQ